VDRIKERETQHQVKLASFYMCQYAVSQAEYKALIGDNPAHFTGNDNLPVEQVTWWDATFYCNKLNRKHGYSPTYDSEGNLLTPEGSITQDIRQVIGFRLPTEAEWEYACRAGTDTPFNTGYNLTTDQANYDGNYPYNENKKGQYRQKTVPVNSFAPNDWKLYNMHGNVWEWCYDWYDGNYYNTCKAKGTVENPIGASSGTYRVLRGGGWDIIAQDCRSASRVNDTPDNRNYYFGFRLVFVPQFIS
jgi:formylglycine-generating enzyme required for sulfatase activity